MDGKQVQSFWITGNRVFTLDDQGALLEVHPSMFTIKKGQIEFHPPDPESTLANEAARDRALNSTISREIAGR